MKLKLIYKYVFRVILPLELHPLRITKVKQ